MPFGIHLPDVPRVVGSASITINLLLMIVTAYYMRRVSGLRRTNTALQNKIGELTNRQTSPPPLPIQQTPKLEQLARFMTSASPILLALLGLASPYLKSWQDTKAAASSSSKVEATVREILGNGTLDQLQNLREISHDGALGKELSVKSEHVVNFTSNEKTLLKVGASPTTIIDTIGPKKLTIQLSNEHDRIIVIPLPVK